MEQLELLRRTLTVLDDLAIPYMLVGSYASGIYGEERMTQDFDIVIDLAANRVDALCAAFSPDEFDLSRDAARMGARSGVPFNALHTTSGMKVDFIPARRDAWGLSG